MSREEREEARINVRNGIIMSLDDAMRNNNRSIRKKIRRYVPKGRITHFKARMKRSPIKPIHLMVLSLSSGLDGSQKLSPIPIARPSKAKDTTERSG